MWLRILLIPAALALLAVSCAPKAKVPVSGEPRSVELKSEQGDSVEYEITIIDPGFSSWFERHRKPVWFYTNDFLASWNYRYVLEWNERVRNPLGWQGSGDNPFIQEIDYRPGIDYGIDLNYKLYHYFKYIEDTFGPILRYRRNN